MINALIYPEGRMKDRLPRSQDYFLCLLGVKFKAVSKTLNSKFTTFFVHPKLDGNKLSFPPTESNNLSPPTISSYQIRQPTVTCDLLLLNQTTHHHLQPSRPSMSLLGYHGHVVVAAATSSRQPQHGHVLAKISS